MDLKRQFAVVLVGAGIGFSGCQATPFRGLSFWKKNDAGSLASAPDVNQQRFDGLSKQLASDQPRAAGQSKTGATPLGSTLPQQNDNFFTSSWKKTTAALTGAAAAAKPAAQTAESDPLRLDRQPKKVGPEVFVAAARLLENQGKTAEAEAQYQKALQAAPKDLYALVGLARLHDRQGNPGKAIELYQQAIGAHPNNSLAYNDLGLCLARQHQHDQALAALSRAVELQPGNAKYRNNLATVLVETNRTEEALKQLAAANPPAIAHYNLGYLLQQKGRRADALRHFQQALALDPALSAANEMLMKLGGTPGQPIASQPDSVPLAPLPPTSVSTLTVPPSYEVAASYSEEVVEKSPPPVVAKPKLSAPVNFHIGDDLPVAEPASKTSNWEADWSTAPDSTDSAEAPPRSLDE